MIVLTDLLCLIMIYANWVKTAEGERGWERERGKEREGEGERGGGRRTEGRGRDREPRERDRLADRDER